MNQNTYDLPISREVVEMYSLTHGVELFLVDSEIFFKSIKILVKSSVETMLECQCGIPQCWIQVLLLPLSG